MVFVNKGAPYCFTHHIIIASTFYANELPFLGDTHGCTIFRPTQALKQLQLPLPDTAATTLTATSAESDEGPGYCLGMSLV